MLMHTAEAFAPAMRSQRAARKEENNRFNRTILYYILYTTCMSLLQFFYDTFLAKNLCHHQSSVARVAVCVCLSCSRLPILLFPRAFRKIKIGSKSDFAVFLFENSSIKEPDCSKDELTVL